MALSGKGRRWPLLLSFAGVAGFGGSIALAQEGISSAGQAELGRTVYAQNCASCHGSDLTNGEFAPPLKGPAFLGKWGGQPLTALLDYMHSTMPPTDPGGLPDGSYAALAAFILHENGGEQGNPAKFPAAPAARARGGSAGGGPST